MLMTYFTKSVSPAVADVAVTSPEACVVDVRVLLQKGQQAQSIRYFEAIVYNKKLLTNNRHLEELPFYNSHFMRCFRDASEIDWNWVKKPEDIDYQYDGSFSPVYLKKFVTGEP